MSTAVLANQSIPQQTSADGSAGAPGAVGAPGSKGELGLLLRSDRMVRAGLLIAAFVLVYWRWLVTQHRWSWGNADWSHAYFVPLVSIYLLWQSRRKLATLAPSTFWPGLLPILVGLACYVFFMVGFPNHMGQGWSLILTIYGLTLLLLGARIAGIALIPIGYLAFGVTISDKVMEIMTFKLQLLASQGAYTMLRMLGITVDLQGNVLEITDSTGRTLPALNVAEACSGMRMLIAFVALGVAMALVACKHWWQRVALVLLAPPVAVLVNVVRVASLGIASMWDSNLAAGEAHTFIGTLWLIPGFMLYLLIVWALNRSVREAPAAGAGAKA